MKADRTKTARRAAKDGGANSCRVDKSRAPDGARPYYFESGLAAGKRGKTFESELDKTRVHGKTLVSKSHSRIRQRRKPKESGAKKLKRIGIIGIGSPLRGDDGIGIMAIDALERGKIPKGVRVFDAGTNGMALLHILPELDVAIIVDAAEFGGSPGEVASFEYDSVVSSKRTSSVSLHECDVLGVIALARKLGGAPERIIILAVQPKSVSESMDLSPEVARELPNLLSAIKKCIRTLN